MVEEDSLTDETTILYLTDSELDPYLADRCRKMLLNAANGRHIVSVSQKPLDFGENICVGEIGRSGISFDTQIEIGARNVKTRWVAVAEHDCIYPPEHFDFIPPDNKFFWYNMNVWFLQYHNPNHPELDGQYSYWPGRKVHSQLICDADIYRESCAKRLQITGDPAWSAKYKTGKVGEPGAVLYDHTMAYSRHPSVRHLQEKLRDYCLSYESKEFSTKTPTIDIRHGGNFSGPRRGKRRTYSLSPWGNIEQLFDATYRGT